MVLVAFLLPWFSVNPGRELQRAAAPMQQQIRQQTQSWGGASQMPLPFMQMQTNTVYIAGGDIGRYIGWMILAMSITAAVMVLLPRLAPSTAKLIAMIALGAGAVFVMYLLTSGIRHVHAGLIIVLVGYATQAIGLLRNGARLPIAQAVTTPA